MVDRMPNLTGMTIETMKGKKYTLTDVLGFGSQGVVYNEKSGKLLIKLYYPSDSEQVNSDVLERLSFLSNSKMPPNFVTVLDVINTPYIGYVMEKISGYKPLNSYLVPPQNQNFFEWYSSGHGLRERLFIGYIIAKAFGELERENLSYCDISGNNILIRVEKNVSVKMIDVDNIYVGGRGKASVLGTPRYIAPEVINKQKNPDVLSDNYALAVILFELLRVGHPYISDDVLDGTPEDEEDALAGKYPYVTDDNSMNMLPRDMVFTDKLSELFERCFVDGKKDRIKRPSAIEFQHALLDASNKLVRCPSCKRWYYARKTYTECPWECGTPAIKPDKLNFYDVLYDGESFQTGRIISKKLVNSYCIKPGKNQIKSMYVLRFDDIAGTDRSSENYMTIAVDKGVVYAYNEFSKRGIFVKTPEGKYEPIPDMKACPLTNGAEIYYEIREKEPIKIECGGKPYSFIRVARFVEAKK